MCAPIQRKPLVRESISYNVNALLMCVKKGEKKLNKLSILNKRK